MTELKVGVPQRYNEQLPGFTLQQITLSDQLNKEIATADIYLDMATESYYSAYWTTSLSESELVELVNACLSCYEEHLLDNDGESPEAAIVFMDNDEHGIKYLKTTLKKFLDWKELAALTQWQQSVSCLRICTRVGDFCLDLIKGQLYFSIVSRISNTNGFARLLSSSASSPVSQEEAAVFFEKTAKLLQGTNTT